VSAARSCAAVPPTTGRNSSELTQPLRSLIALKTRASYALRASALLVSTRSSVDLKPLVRSRLGETALAASAATCEGSDDRAARLAALPEGVLAVVMRSPSTSPTLMSPRCRNGGAARICPNSASVMLGLLRTWASSTSRSALATAASIRFSRSCMRSLSHVSSTSSTLKRPVQPSSPVSLLLHRSSKRSSSSCSPASSA
jgi:hypothetical protein